MLNRKRIFAIVLFVLIGLFVYTFANPSEDLEPLDNDNNIEDVDKNKDDEKDDEDVIQLQDQTNNILPQVVAVNYNVLRTAVENGNDVIDLETEDEELNGLLEQLEDATNDGQITLNTQVNDQNLVNTRANTINQLLTQINALLARNLEEAIEDGNRVLDYYLEARDLNPNLIELLSDLSDVIDDAEALENPTVDEMLDAATEILELLVQINEFQSDLDIINLMSLMLVPSTTDWTNKDVTLTTEIDIENSDLIDDVTIVRGDTCNIEEDDEVFTRLFENLVMEAFETETLTVSENDDYTACVTFINDEVRSESYRVTNIDKIKPSIKLDGGDSSNTYRPLHRRAATVTDVTSGVSAETLKYIWTNDKNILTTAEGFQTFNNKADLWTPANLTGTYYLVIVAKDQAGNEQVKRTDGFKLDNTIPTVSFGTDGNSIAAKSYSTTVSVTEANSGIRDLKYQWIQSSEIPSLASFNSAQTLASGDTLTTPNDANGEYYLWVLARDRSEIYNDKQIYNDASYPNYVITGTKQFILDNTAPEISSITKNPDNWTNGNVTLTVNATDNITNPTEMTGPIMYSFDNGITYQEENNKTFTANSNNVNIIVKDGAGNISAVETVNISNIDRSKPSISLNGTNQGKKYQKSHSRTITVTDSGSGVNASTLVYKWSKVRQEGFITDGTPFVSGDTLTTPTETGQYYLMINAYDNAGNGQWVSTWAYYVDNTAPEISSITKTPDSWTNGNVTLTVNATDNITNPTEMTGPIMYSFNNGEWQEGNAFIVTDNTTVSVRVKDGAGNISGTTEMAINNIDKTGPEFSGPFSGNLIMSNERQNFQINATDPVGINKLAISRASIKSVKVGNINYDLQWYAELFRINPTTMQFEVATKSLSEATWDVEIELKDTLGNSTIQKYSFFVDDVTAPVITITTGNPIDIEYNTEFDLMAGVSALDNQWAQISMVTPSVSSIDTGVLTSYTVTYTANDGRGNVATLDRVINIVDKTGPEFSGPFNGILIMDNTRQTFQINVSDFSEINKKAIGNASIKSVKVGDRNYDLQWYAELFRINPTTMQFEVATKSLSEATWDVVVELEDIYANKTTQKYSFFVDDVTAPVITITTGNPVNVEYNTEFDLMAGVSALDNQWAQNSKVTSSVSTFDTSVVGTYTVIYSSNDGRGNIATLDRIINVVDTTKPVLEKIVSPDEYYEVGTELPAINQLVKAIDNYDGDITDKVYILHQPDMNKLGTYLVEFYVKDSSGNQAYTPLRVHVVDTTKPVLEKIVSPDEYFEVGTELPAINQLVKAIDNYDGDITDKVYILHQPDMNKLGTYLVEFYVKDSSGNQAYTPLRVHVVDTTAPTFTVVGNPTVWTKENVTLTINAQDNSGLFAELPYSFDNGNTWQAENSMTFEDNQPILYIKVKDMIGNISVAYEVTIDKIDKIAPTLSLNEWPDFRKIDIWNNISWFTPNYSVSDNADTNVDVTTTVIYRYDEVLFPECSNGKSICWPWELVLVKYIKTFALGTTYSAKDDVDNSTVKYYDFITPILVDIKKKEN